VLPPWAVRIKYARGYCCVDPSPENADKINKCREYWDALHPFSLVVSI
jgi:hypothetical protein